MEAKNTVMDEEQFKALLEKHKQQKGNDIITYREVAEAQAEISFKAGVNFRKALDLDALNGMKQAGIREVAEKLEAWRAQGTHLVSDEAIQAIKEWGGVG